VLDDEIIKGQGGFSSVEYMHCGRINSIAALSFLCYDAAPKYLAPSHNSIQRWNKLISYNNKNIIQTKRKKIAWTSAS
jgi:hypothetical protein